MKRPASQKSVRWLSTFLELKVQMMIICNMHTTLSYKVCHTCFMSHGAHIIHAVFDCLRWQKPKLPRSRCRNLWCWHHKGRLAPFVQLLWFGIKQFSICSICHQISESHHTKHHAWQSSSGKSICQSLGCSSLA